MNARLATAIMLLAIMATPAIAPAQDDTDNRTHIVTGCLRKGAAAHIYYLTDEDGKTWNIRGQNVRLAPHVAHTVTVTGTNPQNAANTDDTSPQNDLVAKKVEDVRNTCSQP